MAAVDEQRDNWSILSAIGGAIGSVVQADQRARETRPFVFVSAIVAVAGDAASMCGVSFSEVLASFLPGTGASEEEATAMVRRIYAADRARVAEVAARN